MKRLLIVLLTVGLLVGCNRETGEEINGEIVDIGNLGSGYDLLRDTNTGCIYIREGSSQAYPITPYFGEDGKVAGCGQEDLDKSKYN